MTRTILGLLLVALLLHLSAAGTDDSRSDSDSSSSHGGKKLYCGPPDSPAYGGFYAVRKWYPLKSVVKFFCNKGFELKGYNSAVCVLNKWYRPVWSRPSPKCVRKFKY